MREKDPEVTVIVTVFNREDLIERAIHSVLGQSFQNFEIIVVDDASTDNTETKVKEMQEKDSRIRYCRHEYNLGVAAARNTGLRQAKGYYVTFLDSDDQMLSHKLKSEISILNNQPDVIICATGFTFVHSETGKPFKRETFQEKIIDQKTALRGTCMTTADFTVVRDAALKIDGFDESQPSRDDYDFWIRILSLGSGIQVPVYTVNKFVLRDDQVSHGVESKLRGTKLLFEKFRNLFESDPIAHSCILSRIGLMLVLDSNKEAIGYYTKAYKVDPRTQKKIKYAVIVSVLKIFRGHGIFLMNKYYRARHPQDYLLW